MTVYTRMIKNIMLIVKFSFNSHKNGKINNDAMVPGKNGKYPIPNPEQKNLKFFYSNKKI